VWLHIHYAVQPLSLKCGATLLTVAEFEALPLSERQGLLGGGEKKLRRHAMPCAMCRSCIEKSVAPGIQLSLVSVLLLCKQVPVCATPAAAPYPAREGLVSLFLCISSNHVILDQQLHPNPPKPKPLYTNSAGCAAAQHRRAPRSSACASCNSFA